jgi:hypothetical protein
MFKCDVHQALSDRNSAAVALKIINIQADRLSYIKIYGDKHLKLYC